MFNEGKIYPPGPRNTGSKIKQKDPKNGENDQSKVEDFGFDVYKIDDFMSADEARAWINYGERESFERCFQTESYDAAHRQQGRIQLTEGLQSSKDIARIIFNRLLTLGAIPRTIDGMIPYGCMSNIRLYRYNTGDSFGKHIDESHFCLIEKVPCTSQFTCLIYLNGNGINDDSNAESNEQGLPGLYGGALAFYQSHSAKESFQIFAPKVGTCILHRHGHMCRTHESQPILNGVKYVLRTDVVYTADDCGGGGNRRTAAGSGGTVGSKKKQKKKA